MILGTGIDLVETARLQRAWEESGDRLLERLLLPAERAYCLSHRQPLPHVAARFAAKEAVAKAFGTGIGAELGWLDIEVRRTEAGQPVVVLHGKGQELFLRRGGARLHLSLTHTEQYAAACVVLEGGPPT